MRARAAPPGSERPGQAPSSARARRMPSASGRSSSPAGRPAAAASKKRARALAARRAARQAQRTGGEDELGGERVGVGVERPVGRAAADSAANDECDSIPAPDDVCWAAAGAASSRTSAAAAWAVYSRPSRRSSPRRAAGEPAAQAAEALVEQRARAGGDERRGLGERGRAGRRGRARARTAWKLPLGERRRLGRGTSSGFSAAALSSTASTRSSASSASSTAPSTCGWQRNDERVVDARAAARRRGPASSARIRAATATWPGIGRAAWTRSSSTARSASIASNESAATASAASASARARVAASAARAIVTALLRDQGDRVARAGHERLEPRAAERAAARGRRRPRPMPRPRRGAPGRCAASAGRSPVPSEPTLADDRHHAGRERGGERVEQRVDAPPPPAPSWLSRTAIAARTPRGAIGSPARRRGCAAGARWCSALAGATGRSWSAPTPVVTP